MTLTRRPAAGPRLEPGELLHEAEALLQHGRHREALHRVEAVLDDEPSAHAHALRGEILRQVRRTEEAIASFRAAMAMEPDDDWTLARFSETLRDLGRFEEARPYIDRALELRPNSLFALMVKGELLRATGHVEEAIGYLRRSLELNQHRARAYAREAELLRQGRHHEESLSCYDGALDSSTHSAWVLASLAEALRTLGDPGGAHQAIDAALELWERHLALLGNKGEMLRQVGRFEDALACYDRAEEVQREKGRMLVYRAQVLADLDRIDEADAALARALTHSPEDAHIWWVRADLHLRQGNGVWAGSYLARVIALKPDHAAAVASYARLLCEWGELAQARRLAEQYHALRKDDWGEFLLGVIAWSDGDPREGRRRLHRAIAHVESRLERGQNQAWRPWRLFNLALYHLVLGERDRANSLYRAGVAKANLAQVVEARDDLRFLYALDLNRGLVAPLLSFMEQAAR